MISGLLEQRKGFTLIELLVVIVLITLIFATALPVSQDMIRRYRAAIRAQEVMHYVSGLRRDAFLYSERHLLDSRENMLTVDGDGVPFEAVGIAVEEPIFFYSNGTTSSGRIAITVDGERYLLNVTAPFGGLTLEPGEKAA